MITRVSRSCLVSCTPLHPQSLQGGGLITKIRMKPSLKYCGALEINLHKQDVLVIKSYCFMLPENQSGPTFGAIIALPSWKADLLPLDTADVVAEGIVASPA